MITYLGLAHILPWGGGWDDNLPWTCTRDDNLSWTCTHSSNTNLVGWVGWGDGMITYLGLAHILPIRIWWDGWGGGGWDDNLSWIDKDKTKRATHTQRTPTHTHTHKKQKKQTQGKPYKSELVMNIKHVPVNQNRMHKRDKNRGTSETKTEAQARYLELLDHLLLCPCQPSSLSLLTSAAPPFRPA